MHMEKRLSALLLAALLLFAKSLTVSAQAVNMDVDDASITVTMLYNDTPVAGGTLTLYKAGEVQQNNGDYSFILAKDFLDSGLALTDLSDPALAKGLADYAKGKGLSPLASKTIGSDGKAVFSDLGVGLYLVVQTKAASGYELVAPFLISVPMYEDGEYSYAVDAAPKFSLSKKPVHEKPPEPTSSTGKTTLPQTGQLNWPVPVLSVLGMCLFLLGWRLRLGGKRYE